MSAAAAPSTAQRAGQRDGQRARRRGGQRGGQPGGQPASARTGRWLEFALLALAVVMAMGAYGLVGVTTDGAWPPGLLEYGAGLGALALMLHLVVRWRAPFADPVLLPIATLLNGLGLALIHRLDVAHSPATHLASRQLVWTAVGVVAAAVVLLALGDHRLLRRYTFTAMVAGLVLLLLPLLPVIGTTINGARIWIHLGPLSFQPSELAKITLTIFFAGYLVTARDTLSLVGPRVLGFPLPRPRDLGPILVAWLASLGVLVLESDLGTSLLFFGLFVAMLYVATQRFSWVVVGLVLFLGGAVTAWRLVAHVQPRVTAWLHAFDPKVYGAAYGNSYQLVQGLFGLANGGLTGTGIGGGRPQTVPFAESDFIVATLGEELGLVGLVAVLVLYLVFVERGLRTAVSSRDGFGKLLAGGLAFAIALQCFVVAGGVLRVIPLTGLTMPFLAYGGSSLLANWMIVGLLLRTSDAARRPAPAVVADATPLAPSLQDAQATQVVRL